MTDTGTFPNDWLELQRKYWESWTDLSRKATGAAAPATNPWEAALDHWWKAVSPAAPDLGRDFMAKIMDQGKAFFALADGYSKNLGAMSGASLGTGPPTAGQRSAAPCRTCRRPSPGGLQGGDEASAASWPSGRCPTTTGSAWSPPCPWCPATCCATCRTASQGRPQPGPVRPRPRLHPRGAGPVPGPDATAASSTSRPCRSTCQFFSGLGPSPSMRMRRLPGGPGQADRVGPRALRLLGELLRGGLRAKRSRPRNTPASRPAGQRPDGRQAAHGRSWSTRPWAP